MEKNKNKKFFLIKIIFFILFIWFLTGTIYWFDIIWDYIKKQFSVGTWTNSNQISFSNKKTTYYINEWNDNILENNHFVWYYYDNIYWFFRLDWSSNSSNNVHISNEVVTNIGSCNNGLKLKWKAYSTFVWYIDFNHNSSIYVYYCKDDDTLYWKSYSNTLWTQIFNWIKIKKIEINNEINDIIDNKAIVNDNVIIKENTYNSNNNNYYNNNNIWWWDRFELEKNIKENIEFKNNENTFWIIK